jgi:DNA-binding PadR family transcriptional regulator
VYELCILGELMDAPAHGYRLHKIVETSIGPVRRLSWGALYPTIRKLEAEGLIEEDPGDGGGADRRGKRKYRVTGAGQARFLDLMLEHRYSDAELSEVFTIKLCNLHHVLPEQRTAIMQEYRAHLHKVIAHVQTVRGRIAELAGMPEPERQSILCALDRRMHLLLADDGWVSREMLRIGRGSKSATSEIG